MNTVSRLLGFGAASEVKSTIVVKAVLPSVKSRAPERGWWSQAYAAAQPARDMHTRTSRKCSDCVVAFLSL